ncbi:MAG: hypothetical protein QXZ57_07225 [Nitrososphaerota archaeon]
MSFPEQSIKTIIEYLTGNPNNLPVYAVAYAILDVLKWATWLVWESGLVTVKGVLTPSDDKSLAGGLHALILQHQNGISAQAFNIPDWLIPVLTQLLLRLLKP